jgi:hypothetical protein
LGKPAAIIMAGSIVLTWSGDVISLVAELLILFGSLQEFRREVSSKPTAAGNRLDSGLSRLCRVIHEVVSLAICKRSFVLHVLSSA